MCLRHADPTGFVTTAEQLMLPNEPYVPKPPYQRYDLLSLSFPLAVITANGGGLPQPTQASLRLIASIYGRNIWNEQIIIPLIPSSGTNCAGSAIVQTDFVNPLELYDNRSLGFRYSVSFDQAVTAWDVGIGYVFNDVAAITVNASPGQVAYQEAVTAGFR